MGGVLQKLMLAAERADSAAVATAAAGAVTLLLLACARRWCSGRARAPPPDLAALPPAPARSSDVLVCRVCQVGLASGEAGVEAHVRGKRHLKAAAADAAKSAAGAPPAPFFTWMAAAAHEALAEATGKAAAARRRAARADGDDSSSDGEWGGRRAGASAPAEAGGGGGGGSGGSGAASRGMQLQGKGVAVVYEQSIARGGAADSGGGEWATVKGGGKGGGGGGGSGGGGGGSKDIVSALLYKEGGLNILEGMFVHERFLTPSSEGALLGAVEELVAAGLAGRLRGVTCVRATATSPLALHFGCPFDWASGGPLPGGKVVEPMPPVLLDVARRLAGKGEALGGARGAPPPDSLSIYDLQPGQFLPPTTLSAAHFHAPLYLLALAGEEDMPLALKIGEGRARGEFASGFVHRLRRRALVALSGPSAAVVQHCLPTVQARLVLLVFRRMADTLREESRARGSTR
jgi:hypothetical protein